MPNKSVADATFLLVIFEDLRIVERLSVWKGMEMSFSHKGLKRWTKQEYNKPEMQILFPGQNVGMPYKQS